MYPSPESRPAEISGAEAALLRRQKRQRIVKRMRMAAWRWPVELSREALVAEPLRDAKSVIAVLSVFLSKD